MKVRYRFSGDKKDGDLVCELTEYMDEYIPKASKYTWYKTYLYNDILLFSEPNDYYQIAFRVPGATRGGIILDRVDNNKFKIRDIHFNTDVAFISGIGCYKDELKEDIKQFIGCELDFSNVYLVNNK